MGTPARDSHRSRSRLDLQQHDSHNHQREIGRQRAPPAPDPTMMKSKPTSSILWRFSFDLASVLIALFSLITVGTF